MLEVLREGKCQVLKFSCGVCGNIFLASVDECSKSSLGGLSYYEHMCPTCNKWVVGKDTGVFVGEEEKLEALRKDILKESLPEGIDV